MGSQVKPLTAPVIHHCDRVATWIRCDDKSDVERLRRRFRLHVALVMLGAGTVALVGYMPIISPPLALIVAAVSEYLREFVDLVGRY